MRRLLAIASLLTIWCAVPGTAADKDDKPKDTEKAAATRKVLAETKISVDFKDDKISEVAEEIAKKIKEASKADVKIELDSKVSGVTRNAKCTYSAKDKPVKEILDEFCKKNGYGWLVVSGTYSGGKKQPAYPAKMWDGALIITKGEERGYPDPDKK